MLYRLIAMIVLASIALPASELCAGFLYFTTASGIERVTTSGTNRQVILSGLAASGPTGIAIDSSQRIYWTENLTSDIHRSDASGGNVETLLDRVFNFNPGDIALSEINNRMVWCEVNSLVIDDLNAGTSQNPSNLVVTGPRAVAIEGSTVYFSNGSSLRTVALTGGADSNFLTTGGANYRDIAIHNGFLYATDQGNNSIVRASLVGAPNLTTLVTGVEADFAKGLVIDSNSNKMYWVNATTTGGNIYSANLDGSNVASILTLTENAHYLAISSVPEPSSLALAGLACGAILTGLRKPGRLKPTCKKYSSPSMAAR